MSVRIATVTLHGCVETSPTLGEARYPCPESVYKKEKSSHNRKDKLSNSTPRTLSSPRDINTDALKMRLTAPIGLLVIALTAQSSASPVAAPPASDLASRDFAELTAEPAAVEKRSYQSTCRGCFVDFPTLDSPSMRCVCKGPGNSEIESRLALNSCIANRNGYLKWTKKLVLPIPSKFLLVLLRCCF